MFEALNILKTQGIRRWCMPSNAYYRMMKQRGDLDLGDKYYLHKCRLVSASGTERRVIIIDFFAGDGGVVVRSDGAANQCRSLMNGNSGW